VTGLAAAARAARHRLIADAARREGARVVLFAHTADDVAEADVMRAEGSTLGRLRDWSPSPAWPEGRGLMLLRPLLDAGRADLRAWLRGRGADWIDDPANDDPRFARARARQALRGRPPEPAPAGGRFEPRGLIAVEDDLVRLSRDADARTLAAALVCAGGGDQPPRGDRLARLHARLRRGEDFTATLAGARLEAAGGRVTATREAGEFRRRRTLPLPLSAEEETVWDGRWAITAPGPRWGVRPATGRSAALSEADRGRLKAVPAAARGARPVLIRDGDAAPVLAGTAGRARALVAERLALALDRMTHERDLGALFHGATPRNHLFSSADISE
jgi:tRNA(Ile)-lysidine synthase